MDATVNVKVAHIRPDYTDLLDWMSEPNNVYIGRKGIVFVINPADGNKCRWPKRDSKWCNPYKINAKISRERSLELYKEHLQSMLEDEQTLKEFKLLKGKTLGCWCKPDKCHGDVILETLASL